MKKVFTYIILGCCFLLIANACSKDDPKVVNPLPDNLADFLYYLAPSDQREGDAELGRDYLLNGDYVESGVPRAIFDASIGSMLERNNLLGRSGINEDIPYDYTSSVHSNGTILVSPNCFQCHAGFVEDEFILGLANTTYDFTIDQGASKNLLDLFVTQTYGMDSPEWEAYEPFSRSLGVTAGQLVTEVRGANPADKLALVLAAHRDKEDLSWQDEAGIIIPNEVIPADPPAWWLLKDKNAMFTTAVGQGDFARLMMASSILTLQDSSRAREIDSYFADVLAFINTLDAPAYSGPINQSLANEGEAIYLESCAVCHGSKGNYPNYLVDFEVIKTDSMLALTNYAYDDFLNWYNESWFNQGPYAARLVSGRGYVAPPLDGVWATAPYLHNGSVPTIYDLLKSDQRPEFWRRSYGDVEYDHQKLGWIYTSPSSKTDKQTYDANLLGYGNHGHTFGDHLSESDRMAVIEYLKTF